MDSFQQPHGYIRPPHPPDPHHHFHQMPPPPMPSRQPAPPQAPWYSSQFQYHHPSQNPSPPSQWPQPPPPQQTEHYPPAVSYPPPPPSSNPYPYHPSQFHAPPPPPPPLPHARSHAPPPPPQYTSHSYVPQQPYHQEWSNPSWPANLGYPAQSNEEDWAAKARAWAAKSTMESQNPQSQFSPAGRVQEQGHYHDQYQQSVDSRYTDVQNQSHPSSTYQQFSYLDASAQRLPGHSQDAASVNLETSYTSDGHSYGARDGTNTGDPTVSFEQGNMPTNPSVHQQEVPSSYSSVAGKEAADQIQQSYTMFPLPISSSQEQRHMQPPIQATFAPGSNSVDSAINPADQPLDFAPRFSHDSDLQMQSTYSHHDSGTSMNWAAPVAPAGGYAPIPAVLASGPQHDPSIAGPGHVAPPFGRFPGPGLPPAIPPTSASFVLSTGTAIHPTAGFSADPYGVPERPKKASVPNWLREEIKKTVIAAPSVEHPKEETSMDDSIDRRYGKGDEADSKSIDSSRSADEEDEEDLAEAARTAAINQEIKRVLTEVLLKVTDELFDEIATKVLEEDDLIAEVGHNGATSNHKPSASPPSSVLVPKASAKVLVPLKAKEMENDVATEKSNSSAPGDVLGLGNYGSDADDGDDEIESSSVPTPSKEATNRPRLKKNSEDTNNFPVNSSSQLEEHGRSQTKLEDKLVKIDLLQPKTSNGAATDQLHGNKVTRELDNSNSSHVAYKDNRENSKDNKENDALERSHNGFNGLSSKNSSGLPKSELPGKNAAVEKATDDNSVREGKRRPEKNDRHDRSSEKESVKEVHVNKTGTDEKSNEIHRRKDEKHERKEKRDYNREAKERAKEPSLRHGEETKESEPRKKPSHDVKDDKKEADKPHRSSGFEHTSRKREHTKDKGEHKSRQKDTSNPDRHKRRRSSSVGSRGRSSRDHAVNHSGDSSGEGSDGSKRKSRSRRRDSSPSPVRSKRRQVSRSPYSKRSQRRHSPYPSLDNSRGRRSRSRSPVRRQR